MCGIVGMSFRKGNNSFRTVTELTECRKIFTEMLIHCQERGSSATGIIYSHYDYKLKKPVVSVLKAPLRDEDFVKIPEYKAILDKVDNDAYFIIGHTRAVTQGSAQNNRNNHPHISGKTIGVHNGMIHNDLDFWKECEKSKLKPSGTCDSEAIFALVEHHRQAGKTMEEALGIAMKAMKGWYSLALMDVRKPTQMIFVKDKTTPLNLAWMPGRRVAYITSERRYLEKGVKKVGLSMSSIDWVYVPEFTIHTIDSSATGMFGVEAIKQQVNVDSYTRTKEDEKLFETTSGLHEGKGSEDDYAEAWKSMT